ncbi:MAG TPA: LPXTG cell wall anchor domain-containing protein, partial [Allosphingosinicella sp.]|jgi:LPXTG-motif cell wall-anchored protein
VDLGRDFDLRPVDVLDPASLGKGRLLFLAQPQRLAPAELAALDGWIRGGGRALILTDPMLAWPSELPPGDIRRPPPVGLLAPLLGHWRVALEPPADSGEVAARWKGRRIRLDSPGRLRSASPDCIAEEAWTALCRLGRGTVRLVADADLMRDPLWTSSAADNPAVVGEWLDALAGLSRPRAGRTERTWAAPAMALLVLIAGIGLLLRRRRKR